MIDNYSNVVNFYMVFKLDYVHQVQFNKIPLAWTNRFEFFTPDLEHFPLMYVHRSTENGRLFGFPFSIDVGEIYGNSCDISILFVCNQPQGNTYFDLIIKDELSNRIGIANAVSRPDIDNICVGKTEYKEMLEDLWRGRIEKVYGDMIPHGRIYDEIFGIVRFSASGVAPRLGKTSELRMTYWFLKEIGQPVMIQGDASIFDFCEFYLLPSMEEIHLQLMSDPL